jgi:hypothetical protein
VKNISDINAVVEKELSLGGSGGNLPKWVLRDEKGLLYAKGRSTNESFEPEAEVCAFHLAELFGIPAIEYKLLNMPDLSDKPVCASRDYSDGRKVMSLFRYIEANTGQNPANLSGEAKFQLIESMLNPLDRVLHRVILVFDYIVGNTDRHLRNFDVWLNKNGSLHGLVHMFDTGACLFSTSSDKYIRMVCRQSDNFVPAKPYASTHTGQIKLLNSMGYVLPEELAENKEILRPVKKEEIYKIINSYFERNRAKYLCLYVKTNAERLGLLCQQ